MKEFISAQQLLLDSYSLAGKAYGDGFKPKFLVALWRGGCFIGASVHEYFKYLGVNSDHIAIRTSSYEGQTQNKEIKVHGLGYLVD